ncbi:hypothetical protein [Bacillus sp. CGMCC 1.16541]|uniref:hypothetical protein n=1 Tax=Bacillus sp. CGMCC 1.16541 TaxID=2185143 RepID=UPI000D72AC9C|nr:hypothetical protein [Bacillus sp. CGMCC 1.16541]
MAMNKVKKAMVGTALAGTLVVGAGFGTYSWFTSNAEVSGEVVNSTLSIKAEVDGEKTLENIFEGQSKLAPSRETVERTITITNDGEEDVYLRGKLQFDVTDKTGTVNDALRNGYLVKASLKHGNTVIPLPAGYADNNGYVSGAKIAEVVDKWLPSEGGTAGDQKFKAKETLTLTLKVKLAETAGNDYQGATFNAGLDLEAKQVDTGAKFTEQ